MIAFSSRVFLADKNLNEGVFINEKENIINPIGIVVNRELGCLCSTCTSACTGSSPCPSPGSSPSSSPGSSPSSSPSSSPCPSPSTASRGNYLEVAKSDCSWRSLLFGRK